MAKAISLSSISWPSMAAARVARVGSWTLAVALVLTCTFNRDFVKIRIGPLYILEACFLFCGLVWLPALKRQQLPNWKSPLFWLVPFILWGAARLGLDLLTYWNRADSVPFARLLQHCILFIYPLMWVFLGFVQVKRDPDFTPVLMVLPLAATLGNFSGLGVLHTSVGPLLAIAAVYAIARLQLARKAGPVPVDNYLVVSIVTLVAFIPFWKMWHSVMQRTHFVILWFVLVAGPFLIKKPGYSARLALRSVTTLILSFLLGGILYSWVHYPETRPQFGQNWVGTLQTQLVNMLGVPESFQKGDDRSADPKATKLQFRSRRHMWENTWKLWQEHPVLGNGFNIEIPTEIREGLPNRLHAVSQGEPPVSGPHNSYLQILARLGLVGITLFLVPFLSWLTLLVVRQWRATDTTLADWILFFVILNISLFAVMHVGFESPHNAGVLWLFMGLFLGRYHRDKHAAITHS